MRILNLIQCTNLGGMEQASLRLMVALMRRGHECRVLSLNPLGDLEPFLETANISAEGLTYAGKGGWRSCRALHRRLRSTPADALMMTGHNLLAMMALGRMFRGRRLLAMHFHHSGVKSNWEWQLFYRLAEKRFETITFPSDFVRKEAESIYPPVSSRAVTIRNPIEIPAVVDSENAVGVREELRLPKDAKIVGNAGWLIPRKRFDIFLETAAHIAVNVPSAHFVIAGDGPERERLQALAARLEIAEKVHWLGWHKDMKSFYLSLDALLFNSDWDALGMAPLEAMSYGVPVIASVVHGGLEEIIVDDRYGYLLREHDSRRLSDAVIAALSPEGAAMGLRGKSRVADVGDPTAISAQVEALLMGS